MNETATIITTVIASLGGFELVRYIIDIAIHRKRSKASDRNESLKEILELYGFDNEQDRKRIEWYETRIDSLNEAIKDRDAHLRAIESELYKVIGEKHQAELKYTEAEYRRCDIRGCAQRKPPSEIMA